MCRFEYLFHVEHSEAIHLLAEHAASVNIKLSDDQLEAFQIHLVQLQLWNRSTNLTSITSPDDIVAKHFIDSIAALQAEAMMAGARVLDVGSGAGFPGIPLQIVRPDLHVTLLEPAQKKASFLHFMVGSLRLNQIKVFNETFERFLAGHSLQRFEYIAVRALKYELILNHARGLLSPGGKVILYLSQPFQQLAPTGEWLVHNQFQFELPMAKGTRSIAVLTLAP